MSRTKNLKAMMKVMTLKSKGLSFRSIAKIMGKDVKTVYCWYKWSVQAVDKLAL